jgi:hypothetical protein
MPMPGSLSSGASNLVTKSARKLRMSASTQHMMSPWQAYNDFHIALPFPLPGGRSGISSATGKTRAPSTRAASPVASVELSSMTTISSTRWRSSTRLRRTVATTRPTVASSSRAGRQTETVCP